MSKPAEDQDALLGAGGPFGRHVHLDVTRFCCVACIVWGATDGRHRKWNTLYIRIWVMPLLWLVCGFCFSLSRRTPVMYVLRLLVYFLCCVLMNAASFGVRGWYLEDWPLMLGVGRFILKLMLVTILLLPVRIYVQRLRQADAAPRSPRHPGTREFATVAGGVLVTILACSVFMEVGNTVLMTLPRWDREIWTRGCQTLQAIITGLWLLVSITRQFRNHAVVAWLLLANFYGHRLVYSDSRVDVPEHGFHFVLIALVANGLGLARCRPLGRVAHRYWMAAVFLMSLLWTPGLSMPLEQQLPEETLIRCRWVLLEAVIVIYWLVAGPHMFDAKIFFEDRMGWVTDLTFFLFIAHQAILWALPKPLAVGILLAFVPASWLIWCRF